MSLGPVGMNIGGMDLNSMVSKIVDAERTPKQQGLDNKRAQNSASISAYGQLRQSLDTMKDLMTNFRQEKAFAQRKVDTTDENVVSATATTDAIAGKYAIDVLQLAQSHKIASNVFSDDEKFGPGKLHISLGNSKFTVDVSGNSSLRDVINGINYSKQNPGIRASIINDEEGPRLILASNRSGKDNAIQIGVDAGLGNSLNKLEYKTLEQRVKAIESARSQAQQIINPLTPKEQKIAAQVAEKIENAARTVDQSVADEIQKAAESANPDVSAIDSNAAGGDSGQVSASDQVNQYVKPEDRIPGWTETASGTLLDSYREPQPELDSAASEKSKDVPGWSNTASGTLYDSYVTPEEAQAKLKQQIDEQNAKIDKAIASGAMTPEQAKQAVRDEMTPEERQYLDRVEAVYQQLDDAQSDFSAYQGMRQVQAAQDSEVLLDGVAKLSSDNNIIEDAIDGVNLTLKGKTQPNQAPSEIGIEYDRDSVRDDIQQFVSAYNQFYSMSKQLASVDPNTGEAGPLAGDSVVRSADSRLKRVFSTEVKDAPENLKTLTEFGITTTRQGTLEINQDMLNRQLNNNFDKLGEFFGGRNGFAMKVEEAIQGLTGVTGAIRTRENSLRDNNHRLDDQQADLNRRMDSLEKRTHAKFSAMQDATSKMHSQLAGMMNALGGQAGG
ncbi:flagellar filament capping protein FliD [Vibrio sp.]|uniref:Flagellar hook-associated protein 2 n=1 Tax=Vibrio viridaestus TaxID=2487322 RepID=A0A3N9TKJ3_9VIBR|nr:flagellar filament capping protein FliD [Vibrio viridaestus]MDC0611052.1 flagellar filament capping protein FliD [Vibrio sp.]RQW64095.1 flagellar filament capping protein FliD [Vibrio viridaestus]